MLAKLVNSQSQRRKSSMQKRNRQSFQSSWKQGSQSKSNQTVERFEVKNEKLEKELQKFFKSNKNLYLLSNSRTNEFYHTGDQAFTQAIFILNILQVFFKKKEKDIILDFDIFDDEKYLYHWFCMIISPINAICCLIKYKYRYIFAIKKGELFKEESFWNNKYLALKFIIEFLLLLVHPNIYLKDLFYIQKNYELQIFTKYRLNDIFIIIVLLQLPYHIFEVFNSTKYNSPRVQRINRIMNNQLVGSQLAIKNYIANHRFQFMIISFLFSLFYFAALILISDRATQIQANLNLTSWMQSIWYVIVTMSTVGYGDIVTKTLFARLVVMILVIWGNFWNTIFLSSIFPYMQQTLLEVKAYNLLTRLNLKTEIRQISAKVVTQFLLTVYQNRKMKLHKNLIKNNLKLLYLIRTLRQKKKKLTSILHETQYFVDDIFLDLESLVFTTEDHLAKAEKIHTNIKYVMSFMKKRLNRDQLESNNYRKRFSMLNPIDPKQINIHMNQQQRSRRPSRIKNGQRPSQIVAQDTIDLFKLNSQSNENNHIEKEQNEKDAIKFYKIQR